MTCKSRRMRISISFYVTYIYIIIINSSSYVTIAEKIISDTGKWDFREGNRYHTLQDNDHNHTPFPSLIASSNHMDNYTQLVQHHGFKFNQDDPHIIRNPKLRSRFHDTLSQHNYTPDISTSTTNRQQNNQQYANTKSFKPRLFLPHTIPTPQERLIQKAKRGRITYDCGMQPILREMRHNFQTNKNNLRSLSLPSSSSSLSSLSLTSFKKKEKEAILDSQHANLRISVDPSAVARLLPILLYTVSSFSVAFVGTLRLLPSLIISRRALLVLYNLISDYLTGRYFRTTYTRLEKLYIHYYETPAAFRALLRTGCQIIVYFTLSRMMGWLVGITNPPCRRGGRGLAFLCALSWIGAVVGTGHAFSTAVSLWGGPLRLQAAHHPNKISIVNILRRPWNILKNPEAWFNMILTPEVKPFDPNPLIYPSSWVPLRLLQMVAVAWVASTEPSDYLWFCRDEDQVPKLMKQYLIQLALCDEWYRVFLLEKRVGLAICVAVLYALSLLSFLATSACMNRRLTLLMIPSLLAIIISGWMNIIIFFNRYEMRRGRFRRRQSLTMM